MALPGSMIVLEKLVLRAAKSLISSIEYVNSLDKSSLKSNLLFSMYISVVIIGIVN
jgi:hypothetical protein